MIMKYAKDGLVVDEVKELAKIEETSYKKILRRIADGRIVVARNVARKDLSKIKLVGIGYGLRTKVNANIGTSMLVNDLDMEKRKLEVAIQNETDTVMDLSTGGDIDAIRRELISLSTVPFGTVPIYQAYIEAAEKKKSPIFMTEDDILSVIEKHLKDGVDFMTIHAGIRYEHIMKLKYIQRIAGIVSRGGAILAAWMYYNKAENPLYKNYDYILEMFQEYDAVISLGDALRPGAIVDAHDYFQVAELVTIAELVHRSRKANVQTMVEGPGHVPLNEVIMDIKLQKRITKGAPYYVLGPIVTDISTPYDHISAAIGAALAAAAGADFLCYLTPSEHLSLPNEEQVKLGVIATRIAAHAGDIVKYGWKAKKNDLEVAIARARQDWNKIIELAIEPKLAKAIHEQFGPQPDKGCTMCGPLCVYILLEELLKESKGSE
ncbi:MAG: phosphomethylpyrimidine synthase ThiC [Crenarchaeota archaeon]|nr:phosphomethylpyrimidine synthase ThiC [Thermoproteota archaeon]